MLTIYKRHRQECPRRGTQEIRVELDSGKLDVRQGERCRCALWIYGELDGRKIRESLGTRDWERAKDIARGWIAERKPIRETPNGITIDEAAAKFIIDGRARDLNETTVYKYSLLLRKLQDFADRRGVKFLDELDLGTLTDFRADWKLGPRAKLKMLERLRAFLNFSVERKWIAENPAIKIKAPKATLAPTMPFTRQEMTKILAALDAYGESTGVPNAQRLRAFVLLLRYSGMRIGDVTRLSEDHIQGDRLLLFTKKAGTPVHLVLPGSVVRELEAAPRSSSKFYFWTGVGKLHGAIGKWQLRLQRLFELAHIVGGHAHRFRDTFAVELLLAGVPLERVSVLLRHQSIRVTERHYAPWTRSRQEQLDKDLEERGSAGGFPGSLYKSCTRRTKKN